MITISNEEYEELNKLAYYDNLTGCFNRNWYFKNLSADDEFMCIIVDINNLKTINDEQGHLIGDIYIKEIAKKLMQYGSVIRFGGDEFILVVDKNFNHKLLDDSRYCYGFSIKSKEESLRTVLDKADEWLYKFKHKAHKRIINVVEYPYNQQPINIPAPTWYNTTSNLKNAEVNTYETSNKI